MQILLLHQQVLLQTERLRDLHRSLMMHNAPIPANEMENLLQEIRNLYNLALQLNNENALQLLNEVQQAVTNTQQSPEVQAKPMSETASVKDASNTEKSSEPKPANQIVAVDANSNESRKRVGDIHEMFQDGPKLGDRFSDHQTLGDKIAENGNTKRVSDNLKKPVKDIKAAIGLNEKFQFINHLFNGDAKKYNAFIDQLNVSPSAESAMQAVKEISEANDWESHAASARSFIDVVERRFVG